MKPDAYEIHPWVWLDKENRECDPDGLPENLEGYTQETIDDEDNPFLAGWALYGHFTGKGLEYISDHKTKDQATIAMLKQILKRLLIETDQHATGTCRALKTICDIARAEVKARC